MKKMTTKCPPSKKIQKAMPRMRRTMKEMVGRVCERLEAETAAEPDHRKG
jgi:hypothetical protein